jgi:hypothetical protein
MATPAQSKTLTKREVIEYLGKSKRTVATYIADGRLPVQYVNGPNGKQAIFAREAVERFKREMDEPMSRAVVPANGQSYSAKPESTELVRASGAVDPFAALATHLAKLATAFPSSDPKPWLTLDEAVEWSGLTRGYLLYLTETDAVCVRDMGKHSRGGRWRFNRAALAK